MWLESAGMLTRSDTVHSYGLFGQQEAFAAIHMLLTLPMPALLAWSVGQYLDYIAGVTRGKGWFARNLHVLLLLSAAFAALNVILMLASAPLMYSAVQKSYEGRFPVAYYVAAPALTQSAYALFYFGLADLIRRSRRFVEEARLTI
jgi:hypothetical protein